MKDPEFDEELRKARRVTFRQATGWLHQGVKNAVSTMMKLMVDPASPPAVRLRAAEAVVAHAEKAIELEDIDARVEELERAAGRARNDPPATATAEARSHDQGQQRARAAYARVAGLLGREDRQGDGRRQRLPSYSAGNHGRRHGARRTGRRRGRGDLSVTKAMIGRVRRLEERRCPVEGPDYTKNPRRVLRIVVSNLGRAVSPRAARCRRMITIDGYLIESVRLGSGGKPSDEALDQFVNGFPIEQSGRASGYER